MSGKVVIVFFAVVACALAHPGYLNSGYSSGYSSGLSGYQSYKQPIITKQIIPVVTKQIVPVVTKQIVPVVQYKQVYSSSGSGGYGGYGSYGGYGGKF